MKAIRSREVAVLGAGSWGTALALVMARKGLGVRLWGLPAQVAALQREGQNRRYLPGIAFPDALTPMADLEAAVAGAAEILVAVPSHAFRGVLERLAEAGTPSERLSWATKGLEPGSGRLLSQAAEALFPDQRSFAILSGPSFAGEVAHGLPTAVAVASADPEHSKRLADLLHCDAFRAYTHNDIIGLQVGGAAKNVMAIGAGIADGLGFGANTRAALITRGLAEIMRLGRALGARNETFMGLAGMGDLVLTCTDDQSRNRRLGLALARGQDLERARAEIGQEVEGVATTAVLRGRALELGIEMPITDQIHRVLFEGVDTRTAVQELLGREQKPEIA